MKSDTIDIANPDDVGAAQQWAARRGTALGALQRARARDALLASMLAQPPAIAALQAIDDAAAVAGLAQEAIDEARRLQSEAQTHAAQFEANDVVEAQQALDETTRAVSAAQAELMREATTSTTLTATVDGLALRARFRAATATDPDVWDLATIPLRAHSSDPPLDPQLTLPAPDDPEYAPLIAVLEHLDERVDAVADLVTAEGVHHLVNGNPVRSGAALDIAASGSVPDELDVIRTPQPGLDLTHRLITLHDAAAQPRWNADVPGVAVTADPDLAAWVSTLLPDPAEVTVVAARHDPATEEITDTLALTAAELGLDALSWLRVAADPGELAARVARLARARWAAAHGPSAFTGRVSCDDPAGRDPTRLALSDLLAAAASVRDVLATARALTPADLAAPADEPTAPDAAAVNAIIENMGKAETRVEAILDDLETAASATEPDPVLDALLAASAVGVAEATPPLDHEVLDVGGLKALATSALTRLRARTAGGPLTVNAGDPQATLESARERLTALCGSRQPLLVAFDAPSEDDARTDLGGGPVRIAGADPPALRAWLHDHARVRPACAALQRAHDLSESLGCPARLDLRATQLPLSADRWIEDDPEPPHGAADVVAARAYSGNLPARVVGLAVDAWTTTVPAATHATGLAFHYDEPDATPPQAILVAVAPDVRPERQPADWDLDTLLDVVRSTIALAGERAIAAELWPEATVTLPDGA